VKRRLGENIFPWGESPDLERKLGLGRFFLDPGSSYRGFFCPFSRAIPGVAVFFWASSLLGSLRALFWTGMSPCASPFSVLACCRDIFFLPKLRADRTSAVC